ncbi:hypothetical protein [Paenibacillus sp. H1-7]|uniref:hypothetical protein n=1 Tax=Paenibacillus sp. H1-7 TaxID=2282849 RepID=UPI001EF82ADB|nr:hypothetical protein [Paenibacillus sp. H1-7]
MYLFRNNVNLFPWKTEDKTTSNFTVDVEEYPVLGVDDDIDTPSGKVEHRALN